MKNNLLIYLISVFCISFTNDSNNLHLDLTSYDVKRVSKAENFIKMGFSTMDEAIQAYEKLPQKPSNNKYDAQYEAKFAQVRTKFNIASNYFLQGTRIAYEIYNSGIEKFWKNRNIKFKYNNGVIEAIHLQKEAKNCYEIAKLMRENITQIQDFEFAITKHNVAYKQEVLALTYSARALKRYQDYPIVYSYQWPSEFTLKEWAVHNKNRDSFLDINLSASNKVVNTNTTGDYFDTMAVNYQVTYKVQIAAHTKPIPVNELKKIYSGNKNVKEINEDGWFKYQIGDFKTFTEANNVLEEINLEKAFIAAYNNNRKMSLRLAKELYP
jgi:hypothetical protein